MTKAPSLMVIAGEVSGDMHAGALIRELKNRLPDLDVWGIGGDALEAEGVRIVYPVREMAVLGLAEVIQRYGFFRRVFREMVRKAEQERPDAVLLVDYPGFNLRFAREMKKRGIKVLYYVCPQVWAWHRSRIPKMAAIIDHLMVIFPFEVEVFAGTGLPTDFVGHPLVGETQAVLDAPNELLPWPGTHKVAVMPGSRRQELDRLLPAMMEAARMLEDEDPEVGFLLAAASPEAERSILLRLSLIHEAQKPRRVKVVRGKTREILKQADAAWVKSGTSTLEAALMGCPMAVVYKTAALTYWMGRQLVQVPYLGMVNLLAGHELCPELIQHQANPKRLAETMRALLMDEAARRTMRQGFADIRNQLGQYNAAERAAAIVYKALVA
ncbi:MAG: lipid-A-disaccharide synthase [Kiritimatiellae bacterium]|nr:lipid-A-disaccharide synthase [Kiritimatiellia bacterium]